MSTENNGIGNNNDNEQEFGPDIITLSDDNGKEFVFEVIDGIETDTGRYLALVPVEDESKELDEDDSGELVILKSYEEDGEYYYEEIEDDDEYETVADAFSDRLSEMFEIEDADEVED